MSSMNKLASELNKALTEQNNRKPSAYDTSAEVIRVDNDVVWVHIPGGVDETPVKKTINAKEGDVVQVRVSNGNAWIDGNASNPPTDDTTARYASNLAGQADINAKVAGDMAREASEHANTAKEAADDAVKTAEQAKKTADAIEDLATTARTEAYKALNNTSLIEQIVDTITWMSEHASYKLSEDLEFKENKIYFYHRNEYNKTKDLYPVSGVTYYTIEATLVDDPIEDDLPLYYELNENSYKQTEDSEVIYDKSYYTLVITEVDDPVVEDIDLYYKKEDLYFLSSITEGNPSELGLYELDDIKEGVSNYLLSHIALVNEGLYIFTEEGGYKLLITNEDINIIDKDGINVATYGSSISFNSNLEYSIGNESTYIKYIDSNADGIADSLQICADSITIGDKLIENQLLDLENANASINSELENHDTIINNALDEISKYSGYIIIKPEEPSISVGSGEYSYLKIIPSKLSLVNDNKEVAYLSNERLYAPSAVVTNLYMQTVDPMTGDYKGNIGWVMRSNGHLSLRPMK